jgi:hypothetical protein
LYIFSKLIFSEAQKLHFFGIAQIKKTRSSYRLLLIELFFCWERQHRSRSGLPDGNIFIPKVQIWVNYGGSCNGRCRMFLWHFVHFMPVC